MTNSRRLHRLLTPAPQRAQPGPYRFRRPSIFGTLVAGLLWVSEPHCRPGLLVCCAGTLVGKERVCRLSGVRTSARLTHSCIQMRVSTAVHRELDRLQPLVERTRRERRTCERGRE